MSKYEGRMKAIAKKIPQGSRGDFEIWLENEDGTLTDGERTITEEQFNREFEGEIIVLGADNEQV